MKIGTIVRQGDVLVQRVRATKKQGTPIPRDNGRVVLAYGETTGHAHAICEIGVEFIEVDGERMLISETGFRIQHEEHSPIDLPGGVYRVTQQREYSPEEIRNVRD
jgi:hypothetical protein